MPKKKGALQCKHCYLVYSTFDHTLLLVNIENAWLCSW